MILAFADLVLLGQLQDFVLMTNDVETFRVSENGTIFVPTGPIVIGQSMVIDENGNWVGSPTNLVGKLADHYSTIMLTVLYRSSRSRRSSGSRRSKGE